MPIISMIVAIDEQGGMGKNNQLLCHLPADLKYFKAKTLHKPIVMGRKTYESIGRPLPERKNMVFSRTLSSSSDISVVTSVEAILDCAEPEVMIIGGAEIFSLFMPYATQIYITRIHHIFDADVFFPTIDESKWTTEIIEHRLKDEKNHFDLTFECKHRKY